MNRICSTFIVLLCTSHFVFGQKEEPSEKNIQTHVEYLASDALEGRGTNSVGYQKASEYVMEQFQKIGLTPIIKAGVEDSYFQDFRLTMQEAEKIRSKQDFDEAYSRNVVGMVQGTDRNLNGEYIFITAHLDHIGNIDDEIHNGANDNATGSAAVIELARIIAQNPLKRSVVFVLFGAEEIGLVGSRFFVENLPVPLSDAIVNLNIDGIGAYVDQPGEEVKLIAVGADKTCPELLQRLLLSNLLSEEVTLDTNDPANLMRRSDQYNFHLKAIPVIMFTDYGNGHYHKPTDDAHRLQYVKLARVTNMIYQLTSNLGNGLPLCR